jgi:DNA-binding IclR family transcriptional regulator
MNVLAALSDSPDGRSSAQLAERCGITTSTCALVMAELEHGGWVTRLGNRRYVLGDGLFGLVHGLRAQFPLLDRGRDALNMLHERMTAGCSMSRIGARHLTIVDSVGHRTDGAHAVGHRFPIDPPFGLVAMAWRGEPGIDTWLQSVTPRLARSDIDRHHEVLAQIRARGYGAWRFDDAHASLHDRLTSVLASLEPTASVTRQLSTLMTIVTLESITGTLERELATAEFVVLPIFDHTGQPKHQIEIHLGRTQDLTLDELNAALETAQQLVTRER